MNAAHVPFSIIDYSFGNPGQMSDGSWQHRFVDEPEFDVNLVVLNGDAVAGALSDLPGVRRGRYTIGSWTWELPEMPDQWLEGFAHLDEVWAPSAFARDAIARRAPVPVRVMPYAVRTPTGPFLGRDHFELPGEPFVFLAMYDVRSVRGRKNPQAALDAFSDAFEPDDTRALLVIKVTGANDEEREVLSQWQAGRVNVRVIDATLTRLEIDSLLAAADCLVSLHRAEGFGLPIAEAMALAKPVIATAWSGNTDFTNEDNSAAIPYRLVTINESQGPYEAGQQWAEPDVGVAAEWMRRLRDQPELSKQMGRRAQATVREKLSPDVVGRLIAERLAEIRGGGAWPGHAERDAPGRR
jgi:glycosyltransferase involved in cell wall biosynthesis